MTEDCLGARVDGALGVAPDVPRGVGKQVNLMVGLKGDKKCGPQVIADDADNSVALLACKVWSAVLGVAVGVQCRGCHREHVVVGWVWAGEVDSKDHTAQSQIVML